MPKALERKLRQEAIKKGLSGKRLNEYVYGGLRDAGWQPRLKRKRKRL
jgi:hypothetical protein